MQANTYEMVIGLEVHVELKTRTKIFCGCPTDFDAQPNTQCCPVCMGLPGALPVLNASVVSYAARAGLATNCRIANDAIQDRKNYFYPDLPKAYQVSQYDHPLCEQGWLDIETEKGAKRIGITRIHIEEDAGKLMHDDANGTRIDLNRCGVPLIELVTEPDFRSSAEVRAFLQKLRTILLCIDVSDCRMNEGSMRCDVNLSVRKAGDTAMGTRTEMKNLNSFAYAVKAVEYEFRRQVEAVEAGEAIVQETRRFDPATGKTYAMRTKENADDYRYFPDPDLPPVHLTDAEIEALRQSLPELPDAKKARFQRDYGLSSYEADTLCANFTMSDMFDAAAPLCREPSRLWTLLMGEVARMFPDDEAIVFTPTALAELSDLVSGGTIHMGATKRVLQELLNGNDQPTAIVERLGLAQVSDPALLAQTVQQVLDTNAPLVAAYLGGKDNVLQALMGKVMSATQGHANPAMAAEILREKLFSQKA